MSIAKNRPHLVYHYCSLETFYNIITNSTIRLSNIKKSNDYEEMMYILPKAIDICDSILSKYYEKLSVGYKLKDNFVKTLFEETFNELSLNCYVICFSEQSDLLSQWRGYANDACGVSILLFRYSKEYKFKIQFFSSALFNRKNEKVDLQLC